MRLKTHNPFRGTTLDARPKTYTKTKRIRGYALQKRNRRLFMANPLCVMCKAEGVTRVLDEFDHIVSLSRGGGEAHANLQGLCSEHHRAKSRAERRT